MNDKLSKTFNSSVASAQFDQAANLFDFLNNFNNV